MALVEVDGLSYRYPGRRESALRDVSLAIEAGEVVGLLGPSGSGKSTLIRALAGLVPHFHGGRFAGRVEVAGFDTRRVRPAELAGAVATVFQDPEEQVVMSGAVNEVAFGLENLGVAPQELHPRAVAALEAVGAAHLTGRRCETLSGGELQRVCLASALALRPRLLLLDEPTSQLDPDGATAFLDLACGQGTAVLLSDHRPAHVLEHVQRILFLAGGRIEFDADRERALEWLQRNRPAYLPREPEAARGAPQGDDVVCRLAGVDFAYPGGPPVLGGRDLELHRGEIVVLTGPNGFGKTTLALLAAGLLDPAAGTVDLRGRAGYLQQDCGRYVVRESVGEEVAVGARGDPAAALESVGLDGFEARHPRDLSSGERERVALAAVLAGAPDLLVLDEPTRGMDPDRKLELAALLREQSQRRATLVVTHDRVFAGDVGDREVALGAEVIALV